MNETQAIRELLAFLVAKELRQLCMCGQPATQESNASSRPPLCDDCVRTWGAKWTDWKDLPTASRFRALLGTDRCGHPFDGVRCDLPKGHDDIHSWTRPGR